MFPKSMTNYRANPNKYKQFTLTSSNISSHLNAWVSFVEAYITLTVII